MTTLLPLVQGRECGACNACCEWLLVDTPAFRKPPSQLCPQASADGCRIYPDRPSVCRSWFCGWRLFAGVPEDCRPDRSGFILSIEDKEVPAGYEPGHSLTFLLFWPVDMVLSTEFIALLRRLLDNRCPIFLALPGPPGFAQLRFLANTLLDEASRAGDVERIGSLLRIAFDELGKLESMPIEFAAPGAEADGHRAFPGPTGMAQRRDSR